jgi:group I intron endonuclease
MSAGIYKITNINTGNMYIGSSINIEQREKDHFNMLKNNKHHSKELQRSYNRTKDKNVFKFEIIEEVKDETELKVREQYYINLYDSMF